MVRSNGVMDEETTACPNCKADVFVPDYARQGTPLRCPECKKSFFYEPDRQDHGLRTPLPGQKPIIPQRRSSLPMTQGARQLHAPPPPKRPQEAPGGPGVPSRPVTPSPSPAATIPKGDTDAGIDVEAHPQPTPTVVVYGSPWRRFQGEMKADVQGLGLEAARQRWVARGLSAKWFNRFVGVNVWREAKAEAKATRLSKPAPKRGPGRPRKIAQTPSDSFGHLYALLKIEIEDMAGKPDLKRARVIEAIAHALVSLSALEEEGAGAV